MTKGGRGDVLRVCGCEHLPNMAGISIPLPLLSAISEFNRKGELLLRSSSTPVLGSLLSSISDHDTTTIKHTLSPIIHSNLAHNHKFSFHQPLLGSCNSSPTIPDCHPLQAGFRRAQSEGNLQGLAYAETDQHNKFSARPKRRRRRRYMEDDEENEELLEKTVLGESSLVTEADQKMSMAFADRVRVMNNISFVAVENEGEEMCLAKGLGIGGGWGEFNPAGSGGEDGDKQGMEEFYKRMIEENPGNPLFLRNYAHFLYQDKKNVKGADEYYSRAILADPNDGELLSQYAKLVWEVHGDEDRASIYFESAVEASSRDSHVHTAYATFLWETEEEEDATTIPAHFHGPMASAIS